MNVLWTLINTWYLTLVPSVIFIFFTRRHLLNLKQVSQKLQGRIDSGDDLLLVKEIINQNIAMSGMIWLILILLVGWALYLYFLRGFSADIVWHWFLFWGVVGLHCIPLAKGQKTMKNLQAAPAYETQYAQYLKKWISWRLRLLK
jgi:hypothetical protein